MDQVADGSNQVVDEQAGHQHSHSDKHEHLAKDSEKLGFRLKLGLGLTAAFVLLEFGAGWMANSLALMSDAGHNLSDALALGFSWVAVVLARRAPTLNKTYGYHRAGVLAASLNSLTLVLISAYIIFEAAQRLLNPPEVQSWLVVAVASVALVLNLAIARLVHDWSSHDLNARSVFLHIITDAAASLGVVIAAIGQALTGWYILDPLISIAIGLLILGSCWGIIKEATNVLLEGVPAGLNMTQMLTDLQSLEGVREVHDLHAWTVGSNLPALSCHLEMAQDCTMAQASRTIQAANLLLEQKYHIRHATLQIEDKSCEKPCGL